MRLWPGSKDGSCPECGALSGGWDLEYRVARIGRFGVVPEEEKLIAATCPDCKTKFTIPERSTSYG